jgi:hypothetical protein
MDLIKIAHSPEFSYLEKVATIVDEFAAGNIDGSTADAIAMDVGIDPEDLLSVYNLAYGEDGYEDYDMEKTAADESLKILEKVAADPEATYLDKVASVAYSYAAGALTGNEADAIAMNIGVDPEDVGDYFISTYMDGDMEKTAADESLEFLEKIAYSPDSTYLEKAAAVVDAFAAGALTGNEADDIAMNMGVDPSDLVDVFRIAYGDELDKEAGVIDAVKNFGGHLSGRNVKNAEEALANAGPKNKFYTPSGYKKALQEIDDAKQALEHAKKMQRISRIGAGVGAGALAGAGIYAATRKRR